MEALLRFIFIVVLVYYGFKLIARYVMPWVIARFIKKQQEKFNNMGGFPNPNSNTRDEGDVHIKTKKPNSTKNDDGFGEYVDFEDVDE
ncbi:MAG: DUF4834 domain-containing protein [Bacteroidota bacterium]